MDVQNDKLLGFALLDQAEWDPSQLMDTFQKDWGVSCKVTQNDDAISSLPFGFECDDFFCVVALIDAPIPNHEAENAAKNSKWFEAISVAQNHQAHAIITVCSFGQPMVEAGKLFVKICASLVKQTHITALYYNDTIFYPKAYVGLAELMKKDQLPILNMVDVHAYSSAHGVSGYTVGLNAYGKDEIAVIDSHHTIEEVFDFLYVITNYILSSNAVLLDGQTIGFTADEKLLIQKIESNVLKIDF